MAGALNDEKLSAEARATAERTTQAVEETYWLGERGFYAFATNTRATEPREAEPGPNRERASSA
jgi:glycogen debranching enzyme